MEMWTAIRGSEQLGGQALRLTLTERMGAYNHASGLAWRSTGAWL